MGINISDLRQELSNFKSNPSLTQTTNIQALINQIEAKHGALSRSEKRTVQDAWHAAREEFNKQSRAMETGANRSGMLPGVGPGGNVFEGPYYEYGMNGNQPSRAVNVALSGFTSGKAKTAAEVEDFLTSTYGKPDVNQGNNFAAFSQGATAGQDGQAGGTGQRGEVFKSPEQKEQASFYWDEGDGGTGGTGGATGWGADTDETRVPGEGLTVGSAQLPSPPAFGVPAEWADPNVYAAPYNVWYNIRAGQNPYDPRLSTSRDYSAAISRGYNPAAGRYMLSPKGAVPGQGSFAEFIVNPGERSPLESLRDRFGALAGQLSGRTIDSSLLGGRWGDFFDYENEDLNKDRIGQNLITALMSAIGGPAFFNNALRGSLERRWNLFANADPTRSGMNAARAFADWGAEQIGRQQAPTINGQPISQMPWWQQLGGDGTGVNQAPNQGITQMMKQPVDQPVNQPVNQPANQNGAVQTITSLVKNPFGVNPETSPQPFQQRFTNQWAQDVGADDVAVLQDFGDWRKAFNIEDYDTWAGFA